MLLMLTLSFSCSTEDDAQIEVRVIEDVSAVGEWLLVDFTVNGEVPEVNIINEGVMTLDEDGTGFMTGTIVPSPEGFGWYIEDDKFYMVNRYGDTGFFNISTLTNEDFVFDSLLNYLGSDGVPVIDAVTIYTWEKK